MRGEATIFALASGTGRAAVAIIRVSGSATRQVVERTIGRVPEARRATLAAFVDPASGATIDHGLVLWFPHPASFTGEDAAEFHLHGGPAVTAAALDALSRFDDLRPAEPGEFTRRAFRNGKMSVAEVESLADLIDAETEAQRRQALRRTQGALERWVSALRDRLLAARALAEAMIDFPEDDAAIGETPVHLSHEISAIRATVDAQLRAAERGEKIRRGLVVAIAGAPNVGKSTLLNVLAGREAAIVSVHAGTTRDPVEVDLDLGGVPVRLVDTAGLRPTEDPVEQEGIRRAEARIESADLVLWLRTAGDDETSRLDTAIPVWRIETKIDLVPRSTSPALRISARTGDGMDTLLRALTDFIRDRIAGGEEALISHLRHRRSLEQAALHLASALDRLAEPELAAESLRAACDALVSVVGDAGTEEILGAIFSRFCIGK